MNLLQVFSLLLLLNLPLAAEVLTFDSAAEWETWERPFGLIQVSQQGQLQLIKFRKEINAVQDAHLFSHETKKRGEIFAGGVWEVGSNPQDALLAIDGDLETYWKPEPGDAREDWYLTIDLGRAVLAREIRLIFPDQEEARPFRHFRVFASTGVRVDATDDIFLYQQIFGTTRSNREREVSIPLHFAGRDSTLIVDADLKADPDQYMLVQYIQIISEAQTENAALAEIEVIGTGDNLALGTHLRGGFVGGDGVGSTPLLFDGNLNTNNTITDCAPPLSEWTQGGTWFRVDLGAVFFIDEIFLYSMGPDEGTLGFTVSGTGPGHTILFSDGTPAIGTTPLVAMPEAVDYTELVTHLHPNDDRLLYIRYLFQPRKVHYLFFHGVQCNGFGITKWGEMQLFSPGYPAQVTLRSGFIDLGEEAGDNRPKAIKSLSWDGDLPPQTKLQLRSRSGNTLREQYTFYDKKGLVVTEEKWNSLPKVTRGKVDTALVVGEDWGEWSNTYQFSGETFQSASPRRYLQLELILSTEDPEVAPAVNSLAIEFEDALVQEARGSVWPRQARPNEDTPFTYTLWPAAGVEDRGFDLLRFAAPGPVNLHSIGLEIGGQPAVPASVDLRSDSLFVVLPQAVLADSVRITFTARLLQNATVFALDLGLRQRPGLWQSVEAAERRANIVMIPQLTGSTQLIGDLRFSTPIFTPNGDGVHDQLEVNFVTFKVVSAEPRVEVYDLAGRRVAGLNSGAIGSQRTFTWAGRNSAGELVEPGMYLLRIDLRAESGGDTALRPIAVAY